MKHSKQIWTGVAAGVAMLLLILDSKTALTGAKEGVFLCIYTVIPSLFPFFVVSSLINSMLLGREVPILRPLGKLCGIPGGGESLLLLGLLGGYPVGAQAVTDAYRNRQIKKETARHLLGFCNNAGPAFIFGMISPMFTSPTIPWALWVIHILSAIIVGIILPQKNREVFTISTSPSLSVTQALERSIKIMANVCGWVILFRVIIAVCNRWFLWLLPQTFQVLIAGFLELSNGCMELRTVSHDGARFILCACLLGLGGLCVGMQTVSVTKDLGTGMYFPGKILQSMLSFLLAGFTQTLLFPREERLTPLTACYAIILTCSVILMFILRQRKKVVAIPC